MDRACGQIGSAFGSGLGQLARVGTERLPVLVACGVAGGIAAAIDAPLAGVVFARELIPASFTAEAFGVVVLCCVCASLAGRALPIKIVATSPTIGIGGSGGVFAPSRFVGAITGATSGVCAQPSRVWSCRSGPRR
ncbi:chloride channel protein [Frankia sp. AvcI1]|uniref:chloride channel protein n=1 Tax=Frankia sp. AvcI1 TaxID=573496 RepID=UPI0006EBF926|nr:chloride channel protein [Frankia sp. AvcI1]